ncbi:hypothetical protein A8F94_08185 [Bacillus sp. FJAT-27225]|uniref:YrzE family protein n=1 Tax=Bacillus sp. FJAT-27225 TaxID=1743144 RepID=UPI00080C26A1|nr:YrzE family protein [Bacillus sp. FJAT-27225]OCA87812.1 hypothetical protein A8F94_08185 [Bacillus sp. FJAT-27225]
MSYGVFSLFAWASIIGFFVFLIGGFVLIAKKKRKRAFQWFGGMAGSILLFILLFQFAYPEEYLYEDVGAAELKQTDSIEEDPIKLDKNSFNISLKTSDYNSEENSIHIEYETGLPDGTVVEIARFSPSFPDSWGEKYKPFFAYTQKLIPDAIETTVKDGLISFTFDNDDLNGQLFPNSILYTTIKIPSTDEVNPFIQEEMASGDEFNQKYSELIKSIQERGHDLYALDNDNGFDVMFYDDYEVKNAYPVGDILAFYKKGTISYKELEKNPSKYEGTPISFTGRILQIQTEEEDNPDNIFLDNYSVIRLALDGDSNRVVYVTVQDSNGMEGIVSDDTITVYGELTGSKTYESVAGYQITIPSMEAVIYTK